jgi:7,8-dihydropterin-6-yl-methyl-4-(beta-D-ribofuranosyl)aminobenzene 5'-phosphate synthase
MPTAGKLPSLRRTFRWRRMGAWTLLFTVLVLAGHYLHFRAGVRRANAAFAEEIAPPVTGLRTTRRLSILPLVDWHVAGPGLKGEAGVAYLVRTDDQTILFDVGFNRDGVEPSPLMHNMRALGIDLDTIDTIVISHNHLDHVGGSKWSRKDTFSLSNEQRPLDDKRVWTPIPMTYPGIAPTHSKRPTLIGSSVATIGAIPRQLFVGWIEEQALAVNVEGRGIVIIVGCGHQTLGKIIARARALFRAPIYGIVGGLHYPFPQGRVRMLGIDVQRMLASGHGPLDPLDEPDLLKDIEMLRSLHPGLVAIGGHDSSDEVIERFQSAFGDATRRVRVGEEIVCEAPR